MKRILVLDDQPNVRELIVEILERAGYHVRGVDSPQAALDLLAAGSFDLLVTDLVMPGISGLGVLERIKALRPQLPVVVVTGGAPDKSVARAAELGASAIVVKPFSHAELRDAASAALAG